MKLKPVPYQGEKFKNNVKLVEAGKDGKTVATMVSKENAKIIIAAVNAADTGSKEN